MFPAELAVTLNGVKFIGGNDAKCVTPVEILLSFDSVVIRRCCRPPFRQEEGEKDEGVQHSPIYLKQTSY